MYIDDVDEDTLKNCYFKFKQFTYYAGKVQLEKIA